MTTVRSQSGVYKQPGAAAGSKNYYAKHLDETDEPVGAGLGKYHNLNYITERK